MMILKKILIHVLLPVLIVGAGLGVAVKLVQSRPDPQRMPAKTPGILVETIEARPASHRFDVEARGTVAPSRQVALQPQVTGRVVWKNPDLELGGFVKEGDPLVRIESRDYEILLEETKTAVEQARAQLAIEEGQQVIARREWSLFADEARTGADDPGLALRAPQLKMAESSLEAARARQKRAELDLSRTTVRAPFNGFVQNTNVEVGQLVNAQTAMAILIGTDTLWVNTAVPIDRLGAITIPGARATVRQDTGGGSHAAERPGRVVRLLGDLDPVARMARVLIEVDDPFNRQEDKEAATALPLLIGSYVEVVIEGNADRELIALPRRAVHDGDTVHVMTGDGTLTLRKVEIAWRTLDTVLIEGGLAPGDQVVTSSIAAPIEGMKLRVAGGRHD